MKVFITGIAGFVGFHLALKLKQEGITVSGCDNFNNYYDPHLKQARVKELLKLGISVHEGDVTDETLLASFIHSFKTTHLVHLAAQAGVRYSIQAPEKYIESNIIGFQKVLEIVRKSPEIKLIYASSSSVYGKSTKIPFREDDPADQPVSFYGATKRCNEIVAASYHHLYGIHATGLRFFTVYGPFGRPDMAYFSFTDAIVKGKPIDVYNYGNVYRDYTYIDDIIDGILAAIRLGAPLEVFNLGNETSESVNTLIEIIENYLGKKAIKNLIPMQQGDVEKTYADLTHSKEKLKYAPKISLKEGMRRFLDWYKDYYSFFS